MRIIPFVLAKSSKIANSLKDLSSNRWYLGFKVTIYVLFMFLVSWRLITDWEKTKQILVHINTKNLLSILGFYGLTFFLFVLAWLKIVPAFGGPKDWRTNMFCYASSQLAKLLPTPIWFIGTRLHLYKKREMPAKTTILITSLETLLHMFSGLLIYFILSLRSFPMILGSLIVISIGAILTFLLKKQKSPWIFKHQEIYISTKNIINWLTIYSLTWVFAAPFFLLIVRLFTTNSSQNHIYLWKIWIISSLISYISSYTLGGLGLLREISLTWFLNTLYPLHVSLLITTAVWGFMTMGGLIWGAISFLTMGRVISKVKLKPSLKETRQC